MLTKYGIPTLECLIIYKTMVGKFSNPRIFLIGPYPAHASWGSASYEASLCIFPLPPLSYQPSTYSQSHGVSCWNYVVHGTSV